jgi:hypothetical protein
MPATLDRGRSRHGGLGGFELAAGHVVAALSKIRDRCAGAPQHCGASGSGGPAIDASGQTWRALDKRSGPRGVRAATASGGLHAAPSGHQHMHATAAPDDEATHSHSHSLYRSRAAAARPLRGG